MYSFSIKNSIDLLFLGWNRKRDILYNVCSFFVLPVLAHLYNSLIGCSEGKLNNGYFLIYGFHVKFSDEDESKKSPPTAFGLKCTKK